MILVIANSCAADDQARPWPAGYRIVAFEDLRSRTELAEAPDMVLSTLSGNGFDAVEVACCLRDLGYRGPYRAMSGPLPDRSLILEEVRAAAPGIDFDVLVVSHGTGRTD